MMMDPCTFSPLQTADGNEVIDIFNYYIENTFAAYPETPVPYQFFTVLQQVCAGYPAVAARTTDGLLAGFGMLRPYNMIPAFRHTAEITYFIRSDLTGRGIGGGLLGYLETAGKIQGITTILAGISSLNEGSIRFHARHGFLACGRFINAGTKKGVNFDIIWMQKFI
jgi:L-amino acid N-acyltransferase YncA